MLVYFSHIVPSNPRMAPITTKDLRMVLLITKDTAPDVIQLTTISPNRTCSVVHSPITISSPMLCNPFS